MHHLAYPSSALSLKYCNVIETHETIFPYILEYNGILFCAPVNDL